MELVMHGFTFFNFSPHLFICNEFVDRQKGKAQLLGNRWPCVSGVKKIDWFLNGICHVNFDTNVMLFQYVQSFISLCNRFC